MSLDMVVDKYALSFIDQIQLTLRFQKVKVNYVSNLKKGKVKCFLRLEAAHCHSLRVHEQQQHHFHDHQQTGPENINCECSFGCCRGCTFFRLLTFFIMKLSIT